MKVYVSAIRDDRSVNMDIMVFRQIEEAQEYLIGAYKLYSPGIGLSASEEDVVAFTAAIKNTGYFYDGVRYYAIFVRNLEDKGDQE